MNDCNRDLHQSDRMQQNAASFNQRRSSCFARSVSLSSPPPLGSAALAPTSASAWGRGGGFGGFHGGYHEGWGHRGFGYGYGGGGRTGAISIRTAASDRSQHRDDARLLRRGRVIYYGSCLPVIRACLLTEEHLSPPAGGSRPLFRNKSGHPSNLYILPPAHFLAGLQKSRIPHIGKPQ